MGIRGTKDLNLHISSQPFTRRVQVELGEILTRMEAWLERPLVYLSLCVVTLLGAFLVRLFLLDRNYSQGWDEGAYLISARLIAAGYQPFTQIYMPQLPLFLYNLAWLFDLIGDSVWMGRFLVVVYSMVGLVAVTRYVEVLSNRVGALAALFILAINPGYFTYSRAVYLEVPATALAMLALVCSIAYSKKGARRWLIVAGVLWSWSVLIKPFLLGLCLTFAMFVIFQRWNKLRGTTRSIIIREILFDLICISLAALTPVIFFLASTDLQQFYYQFFVVNQRLIPDTISQDLVRIVSFLGRDWGMLALALYAVVASVLRVSIRSTLPLALGTLATLALILQVPHYNHHDVVLIPLLTALAGIGFGVFVQNLKSANRFPFSRSLQLQILLGALAIGIYFVNLPRIAIFDYRLLQIPILVHAENCIQTIEQVTPPRAFVVSDQPMLVYRAERLIPPEVAISGGADILAGGVTTQTLIEVTQRDHPRLIVLSNRYRQLADWSEWVNAHYQKVGTCNDSPDDVIELFQTQ